MTMTNNITLEEVKTILSSANMSYHDAVRALEVSFFFLAFYSNYTILTSESIQGKLYDMKLNSYIWFFPEKICTNVFSLPLLEISNFFFMAFPLNLHSFFLLWYFR